MGSLIEILRRTAAKSGNSSQQEELMRETQQEIQQRRLREQMRVSPLASRYRRHPRRALPQSVKN